MKTATKANKAGTATAAKEAKEGFWGDAGNVNFPYMKFETIGDKVKGVYVGSFESTSSKYGYQQLNYVLIKKDGSKIVVGGRNARKSDGVKVMYGMEKMVLGSVVGFIYEEDKDTGKGNPCKIITLKYAGEVDEATAGKFGKMFNMSQVAAKVADIERPPADGKGELEPSFGDDEDEEEEDEDDDKPAKGKSSKDEDDEDDDEDEDDE